MLQLSLKLLQVQYLCQLDYSLRPENIYGGIAWLLGQRQYLIYLRFYINSQPDARHRFLFNPFTVISCLARPTSNFTNAAIIFAVLKAVQGQYASSVALLAFASYLSLYPVLLLPPLVLLSYDQAARRSTIPLQLSQHSTKCIIMLCGSLFIFLFSSLLMTGSWEFLTSTYGVQLLLPDLTPNIGLWWYFFVEMFDPFRSFYIGVFWLHLASYVGGLTIRLRKQPLFVIVVLLGIFAIFQPYPSIADTVLYLSFLPLYRHIFPGMNISCCTFELASLTISSNALFLFRDSGFDVCNCPWPSFLLSLDLCWQRKRKLFLRHYVGMELGSYGYRRRLIICCFARRMGGRTSRHDWKRCETDLSYFRPFLQSFDRIV